MRAGRAVKDILIRDANEPDFPRIVELNAAEVRHTSPMDIERLRMLARISSYHRVAEIKGNVAAFLMAQREDCAYENENHRWFSARYDKFLYIDRIVVDANYAGLKIGTTLYQDIFEFARSGGVPIIACEYNVVPLNEPSRRFHENFGFEEVGTQWLAGNAKKVSMQAARISG